MTDLEGERRGRPVHALGDGGGKRTAVCLIGLTMLALAVIGMYVSFSTVYAYVHPWFRDTAWAVPIRIAHAAMPALWVLFCEYARHVLAARVGLVNGGRMEKVRRSRWLLAPLSTARLRRRMILWEITSYRRALALEAERRAEIARLEMAYGRSWRRRAPAHERLALKLAAVAPAELLPTLTRMGVTTGYGRRLRSELLNTANGYR